MELSAPAKVNLGLRILGRRENGYHLLESLFVPVDLADRVEIERRDTPSVDFQIESSVPGVPEDGSNLAVRAALAFLAAAGIGDGLRLALEKRIPAAAGLGGGSSDAAAGLRGLARIYPDAMSPRSRHNRLRCGQRYSIQPPHPVTMLQRNDFDSGSPWPRAKLHLHVLLQVVASLDGATQTAVCGLRFVLYIYIINYFKTFC